PRGPVRLGPARPHSSAAPQEAAWCELRIWPRKLRVVSCCGWPKNSCGGACSTILPPAMKITRSATLRAKPISCVTHSMVMPSSARLIMVSSTSLTISGSSAEVGSSNSMILGVMHRALAIATRCCCPPESWLGNTYAREVFHRDGLRVFLAQAARAHWRQHAVLQNGQVRKQVELLEHHAH